MLLTQLREPEAVQTNVVFVFGSNLAGRHGKGAALFARNNWGAEYGVGEGMAGNSYALPTKDEKLRVRSLQEIQKSIETLVLLASATENTHVFLVTPVGCGLAGYKREQILKLFRRGYEPPNIVYTKEWFDAD